MQLMVKNTSNPPLQALMNNGQEYLSPPLQARTQLCVTTACSVNCLLTNVIYGYAKRHLTCMST